MIRPRAHYQCLRCWAEWEGLTGLTICPLCHHVYVKWTNYEEWRTTR